MSGRPKGILFDEGEAMQLEGRRNGERSKSCGQVGGERIHEDGNRVTVNRHTASDSEKGNVGLLCAADAARGGLRGSGAADHMEDDGECKQRYYWTWERLLCAIITASLTQVMSMWMVLFAQLVVEERGPLRQNVRIELRMMDRWPQLITNF